MGDIADALDDDLSFDFSGSGVARCKYCHKDGLYWWQDLSTGWRLYNENDNLHRCKEYKREDHNAGSRRPAAGVPRNTLLLTVRGDREQ